jgi:hypothetical protein
MATCNTGKLTFPSRKRKTAPSTLPTYASLNQKSAAKISEWFRAKSTSEAYKRAVKEGKTWLAGWVDGMKDGGGLDNGMDATELAASFDVISGATPKALHAFVVYKCEVMENSYKTAEAIRSAFKHYFT